MSQGMLFGAMFERPRATESIRLSTTKVEHSYYGVLVLLAFVPGSEETYITIVKLPEPLPA